MIEQTPHVITDHEITNLSDRQLRHVLYEKKVLVVPKSKLNILELSKRFGAIWGTKDYRRTEENGVNEHGVASFDNITDHKSKNTELPWHHDISWFEDIKYPIRILKAKSVSDNSPGTQFIDASLLLEILLPKDADELALIDIQLINLWTRSRGEIETRWVPLLQTHPHTKKSEIMLDSFAGEHLKYGALNRAGWTIDARRRTDSFKKGVAYLSKLHSILLSNVRPYIHQWGVDDIVIWDNQSGIMHYRTAITGKARVEVRGFERVNVKHYWQASDIGM